MSYADYKIELKFQKAWIKNHKKGQFYYIANDVVYPFEGDMAKIGFNKTFPPFKGDTKDLIHPV